MTDERTPTCPNCGGVDLPVWRTDGGDVRSFASVIELLTGEIEFIVDCNDCDWEGEYSFSLDVTHKNLDHD